MFYSNTLNLIQVGGGTQVKQGDLGSKFSYKLANEKDQELDDFDKEVAHINLVLDDKIVFTTTATVDNSTVTFNIDKAIPVGLYFLEIKIRDYIFPSDKQTIIFVQSGAVAYDLKELVPNYDTNMTLQGILSDLSQKGIDISDLKTKLQQKANKDEVTNVMTPKGNIAYASLPMTGNSVGWYYYCPDGDGAHGAGNYVWNGTSWYFGGTGDEGYNLLKKDLDYLQTTNLFYKEYVEDNYYRNSADGGHNYDEGWQNSNFIPVSDLLEIDYANMFMYSFYTIDKTFISGIFLYENTDQINRINVPQNAFYVVISWRKSFGYPNAIKTNAKDTIIVSKDGNGDYDSILKASLKAYKKGSKVIVEKGDYDILQEFKDVFGDDFFTNYTQKSVTGIILRNNIIYQFSPLANVYFEYSGSNGNVFDIFSPFNAGKWGFTLDGLNIKTKNAKYCIHDERGDNSGTESYLNKYINCVMYLDNRENTRAGTTQCIGGGLGTNGKIYIDGCVFDTEDSPTSTLEYKPTVSYHNDWISGSKSLLEIKNCYLKRGTIRFGYYGESTKITDCIVSNCSLESDIVLTAESSSYSNVNMVLIEWNNEIRN